MRSVMFQGNFCRVVRVEGPTTLNYIVEAPAGKDALGEMRWTNNFPNAQFNDVLSELAAALDAQRREQQAKVKGKK